MSDTVLTALPSDGSVVWTQLTTTGTGQMLYNSNGQPMCQPVQEYAWSGLNFILICIGFFILALVARILFEVYKDSRRLDAENSTTNLIKKPNARTKR
jgi:hypothetical protein